MIDNQMLKAKLFNNSAMMDTQARFSTVPINHIPVMITDSGKILCIPDSNETFHIGLTAMTSRGKGVGGNTILGFEYWMKNKFCLILNDFQQETFEYSLPCMNKNFLNNLAIINGLPTPYPLVYIYPSHRNLKIGETESRFPYIKMSLPTSSVIRGLKNYFKLDKSEKYITGNIDEFLECRDIEEVKEVLDRIIPSENKFEEMKYKIITIFKNIFDEKICDSTTADAPAFLTMRKKGLEYRNLTVQSILSAGLIPSIQTSEIRSKKWFGTYMAFIVQSIFDDKIVHGDSVFKDKHICLYVPEIDKMWKNCESGEQIKQALSLIGTNGRRAGIALRWDTQDYDSVPETIRGNTRYLFVLRKNSDEEVRGIVKDFNVDKETRQLILSLITEPETGRFDCVALTIDKFILYNPKDGSTSTTNLPQKGRLITPMSQHKRPGTPIEEVLGWR